MKLKISNWVMAFLCLSLLSLKSYAQCIQIESILVDACSSPGTEGLNEMVRFKVGSSALNTSNMSVVWPNNAWEGLIQNATTISSVAQLNAQVLASGGCGTIIQPTGGVLPANATVVLVTSYQFEVAANYFGAITENIYILFQNHTTNPNSGHFGNYNNNPGLRTLTINFGGCSDTVTYDRTMLVDASGNNVAADGATVNFDPAGDATYVNYGCQAPVEVISVDAGGGSTSSVTACQGSTISLDGSGVGVQSVNWSASSGTFSDASSYTSDYTLDSSVTGSVVLTLTGTGSCSNTVLDTITVNITPSVTPTFSFARTLCSSGTIPTLPTTSDNGITGTWNPAVITSTGSYTFTPNNASQCSSPVSVSVIVNNAPNAGTDGSVSVCSTGNTVNLFDYLGGTPDINGTWSPALASGTGVFDPGVDAAGTYTYSINGAGFCAPASADVVVTVSSSITPTFSFATNLCSGGTIPALPTTSDNGITGTWNPAVITSTGSYTFTPNNASQCSSPVSVSVIVNNAPNAGTDGSVSVCSTGNTVNLFDYLGGTPDINGTWSPALASGTGVFDPIVDAAGTYTYSINGAGSCAPASADVVVTVSSSITPTFSFATNLCSGGTIPALPTTSDNGITGTWNPAVITSTGSYTFTPNNASQCSSPVSVSVTVNNAPNAGTDGSVSVCSTGNTVNLFDYLGGTPDINGTWSPALASGTGVFDPSVDAAGIYTYSINGAGSCAPASADVVVTVSSSITPTFSFATNLCSNGTIPALPTTSDNGITGTWNPAVITSTGNYEFTPNDSSQCGASIMVSINVTNAPDAGTNGSVSVCSTGNTVNLFDYLGGTPDINGTWSPALVSGTGVFDPSVDAAGTYIYTVSGTSPCSPASANVVVTVSNPVSAGTNGSVSLCSTGGIIDLFDYLGGTPDTNGTWSPALTSGTGVFDPSLDVAGTYTYTVNNGSCTPDTAEVIVSVTNIGVPTASVSQPTCANPTGVLEVLTPLDPNYEYSLDGTTFQSSVEFTALEPNSSYYVYVRNTINGCQEVSSITYDVNDLPTAPIVSVTSSCQGVQYVATVFSDKENSTYQWFNASGDVIGSTESVQLTATGDYEVEVTANGCVSTVNFSVNNIYCEIPKGISPNGDDKNDEWDLSGFNVTKVEIFNRYGLKVYSKSGGYTNEWHGQSDNGNDLPTATYYYVVEFSDMPSRTGWVYINRQE